jgi:hypothetical protein
MESRQEARDGVSVAVAINRHSKGEAKSTAVVPMGMVVSVRQQEMGEG